MQEDGIKASIKNERFMIGEITCAINRVEEQIEQLFDEKEEFIMAYEDAFDGEHRVYNIMRSGSLFLEEYVLFPKPCPVLFETITDSELLKINRCDLIRAFKSA